MKLNVTQKILFGYIVGFILLLAFAALTYFNGKKIEATTLALAQEKIPGLIAVSSLKSHVQTQTNQLYELYATNDQAMFAQHHQNSMVAMQQDIAKLRGLAEFQTHDAALAAISVKQEAFTNQFVDIMRQPEVNWDAARSALSDFSKSAKAMDAELDVLVTTVSNQTLTRAKSSQQLTDQLIKVGLALAALGFLGVLGMAYYSHRNVAVPLRDVSLALTDVATRRDLTCRLQQKNNDEIGDIATSTNKLLEAFQRLARTLDQSAQEVSRNTHQLSEFTESARTSVENRNSNLRSATQEFLRGIEASTKLGGVKQVDIELHRAQMKFIQSHLTEIDAGTQANDRNVKVVHGTTEKLQKLVDQMHDQIRTLNF
ncbi:MAG: hypothetical protein WBC07_10430 [Methylotenera sp.]